MDEGGIIMASTVNIAFADFLKEKVNLDVDQVKNARASRDWLVDQIHGFAGQAEFPVLYSDKDIFFGSFSRKTKIRELDDIDLMIGLSANGSTYLDLIDKIEITVPEDESNLQKLCHDNTNKLNSRKVINKFISSLNDVAQYEKAEISRNLEAATLKLKSYTWNFDIVPCFYTVKDSNGRCYYLIPDGNGHWKKTDPSIDNERTTTINQKHAGRVLNVIRLVKYWNKRPTMPSMPSYLLECMLLSYFESQAECSQYVDIAFKNALVHIYSAVYNNVYDPKGIQGNLNSLSYQDRQKISSRASTDYDKAVDAMNYENNGDYKSAINKWREIFGNDFPEYTN